MNKKNLIIIMSIVVIICIGITTIAVIKGNNKNEDIPNNVQEPNITDNNEEKQKGTLGLLVTDSETGEGIEGVNFKIYDSNMNEVPLIKEGKKQEYLTTNKKGQAAVDLDLGTYYYNEISIPEPYAHDGETHKVVIEYDGHIIIEEIKK